VPSSESAPGSDPAATPDLQTFLQDCERGVRDWRAAQVDYPAELALDIGESGSYVAAVDVRSTPGPPGSVIPGPSATAEAAFVKCEIAARLTPMGRALEVDDEEWVLRSFTPSGVIRWSWNVTAVEAGDHDLRLELQPAVVGQDGMVLVSGSSTAVSSFFTRTRVEKGSMQRLGDWWKANWEVITLVAAGIGGGILALLGFGEQLAGRSRRLVAAWRGKERPRDADPDEHAEAVSEDSSG
jgi:hypothetical protein